MSPRRAILATLCLAGIACGGGGQGADAGADAPGACARPGPRTVRGLAAGERFSLAVLDSGDALFWGEVLSYVGGDGKPRQLHVPPVSVDSGCRRTVEVAAGSAHACLRIDDGDVRCWGRNDSGQLGIAGNTTAQLQPLAPVSLGPGRKAVALVAGHQHTCARLDDGQLRCWGRGVLDGQDGNQLIPLGAGRTVAAIGAGDLHTCAALDDGTLRCWGTNEEGELGLGDTTARSRPGEAVDLGPGRSAVEIAAGFDFTCARLDDGEVKCWGLNRSGQLGLGDTTARLRPTAPVALGDGRRAVQISAGFAFACARLDDGAVKCWGDNASGQLGLGDSEGRTSPATAVDLGSGLKAVEIAAGLIHVCAHLDSGVVKCWGDNDGRQLGNPDPLPRGGRPDELGDNLPAVPIGG
jgi:alpha-tubulin suppressor-like RCC1 family protein